MTTTDEHALPSPGHAERWQPLRSGLLNLYRYDRQEFWFDHGHLLLRGNNGTGKSRVLALQLPFLLDGDLSSHRVEPDADSAKRMEWNVLTDAHENRTGYTWIEFGRQSEEGDRFCTLGCGLHATKGGQLRRWFFVTRQRIGRDLFLETGAQTPLTQEALRDALGDQGTLYTTVRDYRRAVDDHLFRLGADRYAALIELLIHLRQPQLSRHLDENKLSAALSDSLPPLDSAVVHEVAESFRSLEEDRHSLANYETAVAAVASFRKTYRGYARIVAGRYSEALRNAHSHYERAQRDLRQSETDLQAAEGALAETREVVRREEIRLAEIRAERDALRASPEMKQAEQLERLAGDMRAAEERAVRAADAHRECVEEGQRRREDAERACRDAERADGAAAEARDRGRQRAATVGVDSDFERALAGEPAPEAVRETLEKVTRRLSDGWLHLKKLYEAVRDAREARARAGDMEQQQRERYDQACEAAAAARRCREEAVAAYLQAAETWLGAIHRLELVGVELIGEDLPAWCEALTGDNPLEVAADEAYERGQLAVARERARVEAKRAGIREAMAVLREEAERLRAGVDREPPAPHTRAPDVRVDRLGAPLWRVCDFQPNLSPSECAGYEAALEAAGLLDAWLLPDGRVVDEASGDVFVDAAGEAYADDLSLRAVLRVELDPGDPRASALSVDVVNAVLSRVACVPTAAGVFAAADGQWRNGPLSGRWRKERAEYVGAGAREQARRRRLEAIATELATREAEDAACAAELAAIDESEAGLKRERRECPDTDALRTSDRDGRRAVEEVDREREELARRAERRQQCQAAEEEAEREFRQAGDDLRLTAWLDDLDGLRVAIDAFTSALQDLWRTLENAAHQRATETRAGDELQQAERRLTEADARNREAATEVASRTREFETLQQTAGKAVSEIKARLDAVYRDIRDGEERLGETEKREREADLHRERFDERRRNATAQLAEAVAERDAQLDGFRKFLGTRILAETDLAFAEEPAPESVAALAATPAVDFAREIDQRLGDIAWDDAARDRAQNELLRRFQELQSALSAQGYSPVSESHHEIAVVTCPYQGRHRSMSELGVCLEEEVRQRKQLLGAREREFIENYLIGEIAHLLHRLIGEADTLVSHMNAELQDRPMSSGMRLRFVWEPRPDGPAGLQQARRLLQRTQEVLTAADRDLLAQFLQERIQQAREEDDAGSWREYLEAAVDYRRWHHFGVERYQNGRWQKLTRRTHGTGSGGEKAIALTIPQFAAAAAHYHNTPEAPRLIMLDEAFVGVDADMRVKCMDLLHQFDLDFVMTSEREWGCYATTRGLAIYHLAAREGVDAIAVTRWVWNGTEKLRRDPPPPARPAATSEATEEMVLDFGGGET